MAVRPVIILLASRELRRGPDSPLIRFVRTFEHYLRHVLRPDIHVLEGSYRALLQNGLLADYDGLHPVASGRQGGLVTLGDLVVRGADDGRRVDAVVYLLDPRDATSMFPDSQAVKRECVVTRTPFFGTETAAAEWFRLDWARRLAGVDNNEAERAWFAPQHTLERLLPDLVRHPAGLGVALIAHDTYKASMLEFARRHADFLGRFARRYATGTTGTLLNGEVPERIRRRWQEDDLERGVFPADALPARLRESRDERDRVEKAVAALAATMQGDRWIDAQPSGPLGGDIGVAELVRRGQCQTVIFFEDPHVSREHEADIQLLERATRIPGSEATCLHDPETVARWAQAWQECLEAGFAPPTTLDAVFRHLWGVELVVPTARRRGAGNPGWSAVAASAGWYLCALLEDRLQRARERGTPCRIGVGWGAGVGEVLDAMESIRTGLAQRERDEGVSRPLIDTAGALGPWLTAQPTVGILGLAEPDNEANHHARRLASLYGGTAEALPHYAFVKGEGPGGPSGDGALDAVLMTGGALTEGAMPIPGALADELERDAVGEIGGVVVGAGGTEARIPGYRRIGATTDQLRATSRSVLVAGRRGSELPVCLAALSAGLVGTLVTDIDFARGLVQAAARGATGSVNRAAS